MLSISNDYKFSCGCTPRCLSLTDHIQRIYKALKSPKQTFIGGSYINYPITTKGGKPNGHR